MSERDSGQHIEIPTPSERIGITYHGILAEKMDWKKDALGQFAQTADLRTAVEITNEQSREEYNLVSLGDTLAIKRAGNIHDLFTRKTTPRRFMSVETNLSTAKATIAIDDQGLASEVLKHGTRFDENEFATRVDSLVKSGLKDILTVEKKQQIKLSAPTEVFLGIYLATLATLLGYGFEHFTNSIEYLEGVVSGAFSMRIAQEVITRYFRKLSKDYVGKINVVYVEHIADLFNATGQLDRMRQGRNFLARGENKIVTLKAENIP
jgi:hypothetical protein